jgi:sec-independent protein translocase protein TatA
MIDLAVTIFVLLLVLGATRIPALGDAIGRRVRGAGRDGAGHGSPLP